MTKKEIEMIQKEVVDLKSKSLKEWYKNLEMFGYNHALFNKSEEQKGWDSKVSELTELLRNEMDAKDYTMFMFKLNPCLSCHFDGKSNDDTICYARCVGRKEHPAYSPKNNKFDYRKDGLV